jgi:hypothetical protein
MCVTTGVFDVAQEGEVFALRPVADLDDLGDRDVEAAVSDVLELLDRPGVKDVIFDLEGMRPRRSQTLELLARLGRLVRDRGGSLAVCFV